MSKENRNAWPIVLVVFCVAVAVFFSARSRYRKQKTLTLVNEQKSIKIVAEKTQKSKVPAFVKSDSKALRKAMRSSLIDLQLGLVQLPVANGILKIRVAEEPTCEAGGGEFLDDMQHAPNPVRILLSIEPLDSTVNIKQKVVRIGPEQWQADDIDITLPTVEKPTVFGLYLCTDNDQSGHCGGKAIATLPSEIRPRQSTDAKPLWRLDNSVYYFKSLLLAGDGSGKIQTVPVWNKDALIQVQEQWRPTLGKGGAKRAVDTISSIESLVPPGGSVGVEANRIVIMLRRWSREGCINP